MTFITKLQKLQMVNLWPFLLTNPESSFPDKARWVFLFDQVADAKEVNFFLGSKVLPAGTFGSELFHFSFCENHLSLLSVLRVNISLQKDYAWWVCAYSVGMILARKGMNQKVKFCCQLRSRRVDLFPYLYGLQPWCLAVLEELRFPEVLQQELALPSNMLTWCLLSLIHTLHNTPQSLYYFFLAFFAITWMNSSSFVWSSGVNLSG